MGLRNLNSYLVEISAALVEDYVLTFTSSPITAGVSTVLVPTTDAMYPGAQLVVNDGTLTEVVTISSVVVGVSFTATFASPHITGTELLGGTFPTQQPTDPLFTQSEVLSYLARAQNEFLSKLPLIFTFANQPISVGQLFQPTPADAIELERVALSNLTQFVLLSTVQRFNNTVYATIVGTLPPGFVPGRQILVFGVADSSYNSTSSTNFFTLLDPITYGYGQGGYGQGGYGGSSLATTLVWAQTGPNSSSFGGQIGYPYLTRLYETTQEQIANRNPNWLYAGATAINPQAWFEDRTGVYGWGIAPPPGSNFSVELLYSQRGPATLGLLDTFIVPDLVAYVIKYKAMEYIYRKAGEQRSPQAADYCKQRFDRGIAIVDRYLRNMQQVGG